MLYTTQCCGVREIAGVNERNYEVLAREVFQANEAGETRRNGAFYFFTSNDGEGGYGDEFRDYLIDNGLGQVLETPVRVNPNSQHELKMFILIPDFEGMRTFFNPEPVLITVPQNVKDAGAIAMESVGLHLGDYVRLTPRGVIEAGDTAFQGIGRVIGLQVQNGTNCLLIEREDGVNGGGMFDLWSIPVRFAKHLRTGAEFVSRFNLNN